MDEPNGDRVPTPPGSPPRDSAPAATETTATPPPAPRATSPPGPPPGGPVAVAGLVPPGPPPGPPPGAPPVAVAGAGLVPPGPPPGGPGIPPGPPPGGPGLVPPGPPPGAPGVPGFPGMPPRPMGGFQVPVQGFPGQFMAMPPPTLMPNFPPPVPVGWSEHRAPDGVTPYFYHAATKQSTYTRPTLASVPPAAAPPAEGKDRKKKKKEKPKEKVPIPGTGWVRVTTTDGNVFYFEKENRRSEWSVPEEIAEAVAALEASERAEKQEAEKAARLERMREQERVRAEIAEERERRRKAAEEMRKRKAESQGGNNAKMAKTDKEPVEEYAPKGEEDEEDWMEAVKAEFAEKDKLKAVEDAEKDEATRKREEDAAKKVFSAPEKVQVTPEEGRALFKALLIEKNISPFAPWDTSLPLFINDPRYVLLGSMKERQAVYEEYCRDAGRARRLNKPAAAAAEKKADPEREYRSLLRDEVTSTRTRWDDFRRKWKKDRRFYSFGRDDREREKAFKTHLRELGERKRADAARAEADFFELLKETDDIGPESEWATVKRGISHDTRYDAVGSSSLRQELFNAYRKKLAEGGSKHETPHEAAERKLRERKERQAASLREREQKVREHQAKVSEDVGKSRLGAGREEGERVFGSLLVDTIRDHDMTWASAQQILSQDPRFGHPALRPGDKQRLFEAHIARLGANKSSALHKIFATHAPTLDTPFDTVYAAIADDPLVQRLALTPESLGERYAAWSRARETDARRELDELLAENKFVDFWGRMRNKVLDESAAAVKEHEERDEGEGLAGGGDADVLALAQKVDLDEVKQVLRRDRRYRQFDHVPELREQWIRDYLANLEGSKGSETIHQVGH